MAIDKKFMCSEQNSHYFRSNLTIYESIDYINHVKNIPYDQSSAKLERLTDSDASQT